jgi:hypothetical protein
MREGTRPKRDKITAMLKQVEMIPINKETLINYLWRKKMRNVRR